MKQDQRRISRQECEIDYVRKLARELKKTTATPFAMLNKSKVNRVCNAVLKFAKVKNGKDKR